MKFTTAWANIAKENISLKVSLFVMTGCTLFLGFSTTSLALKAPIVIDRACYSTMVMPSKEKQTSEEMKVFIKESLEQRFNSSKNLVEGYLSLKERKLKEKEQADLKRKGLTQIVILRKVDIQKDLITVEADRLYSIKNIRSTFPIKLELTLETKERTATNPYGLILVKTKEIKEKDGKNDSK